MIDNSDRLKILNCSIRLSKASENSQALSF